MLAGSSLLLPCPVSQGVPAPDVAWYHGSDEVTRGQVGADHSLAISHVIKEDAGLYTCKASNTEGSAKIMVSHISYASHNPFRLVTITRLIYPDDLVCLDK